MVKAILTQEVEIDERSVDQLLAYLGSYSEYISYFDGNNQVDGNWKPFLENDPIMLMAAIINESLEEFENLHSPADPNQSSSESDESLREIKIRLILKWTVKIDSWYKSLVDVQEERLSNKLGNIISDFLSYQFQSVLLLIKNKVKDEDLANTTTESLGLNTLWEPGDAGVSTEGINKILHNYQKIIMHIQEFIKEFLLKNFYTHNNHNANNALYIAFMLMLKKAQSAINGVAKRHLDFYYSDVLRQTLFEGEATGAFVSFELLPHIDSSEVKKGTKLSAGASASGKGDVLFETKSPVTVYPITIEALDTLYLDKTPHLDFGTNVPIVSNIYRNPRIRKGKPIVEPGSSKSAPEGWPVFGSSYFDQIDVTDISKSLTTVGFIIGSPVLYLSEGLRKVSVTFNLAGQSSDVILWELLDQIATNEAITLNQAFFATFSQGFNIWATGKKGWEAIPLYEASYNINQNSLTLEFQVDPSFPAIEKNQQKDSNLQWPSLKVTLNEYAPVYLFSFLNNVLLESIDIDVEVSGMKQLSIYNNVGKVASGKTFKTFGTSPEVGSYLMIGSAELFKKNLTDLSIFLGWKNVPAECGGFGPYYDGYPVTVTNDCFKVKFSILTNNAWLPSDGEQPYEYNLFDTSSCLTSEGYSSEQVLKNTVIDLPEIAQLESSPDYNLQDPLKFSVETQSGFIKLELIAPLFAFGHKLYQNTYTEVATYNAREKANLPFPNKPFVPSTSSLSLNYKASDTLIFDPKLSQTFKGQNNGEYFQIGSFGNKKVVHDQHITSRSILYPYEASGYVYMGLNGVAPPTTLTLLFDFTNSKPLAPSNGESIRWEYLSDNEWIQLQGQQVISDGTSNFHKTGIVELSLPHNLPNDPLNLAADLYWLRVSTNQKSNVFPLLQGVYPNATEVVCTSTNPMDIGRVIPAGKIKKAAGKLPDIKKITQPSASFGGLPPEDENGYYTRVSERLRHKDRALTAWDYESMLLSEFPQIRVAKCTNLNKDFQINNGQVKVVVLKAGITAHDISYFNSNELSRMTDFLYQSANPFTTIEVINPQPEYLLANVDVKFQEGDNGGYYLHQLNEALSTYFCPWLKESGQLYGIGGSIDSTMVLSFIENLSYVEYARNLVIEQIIPDVHGQFQLKYGKPGVEIKTTTPWSIFTSVTKHRINTITDGMNENAPGKAGIGHLEIGLDFIIQPEKSDDPVPTPVKPEEPPGNAVLVFKNKA